MKPEWVFAMALGSSVGWGAFILPFDWLQAGGLAGTLLGFLIGGAMITVIAVSYGLIIRALPVTGGAMAFAIASFGRTHGFIAGWCLMLGYMGIVALNASAVTLVFRVTVPHLTMRGQLYNVAGWDVYFTEILLSVVFLALFAWVNIRGMENSGRFQFIAVVLMLAGVLFVGVATSIYFVINGPPMAPAFPRGTSPWAAVAAIVAIAPWAYIGFDGVPQLAGEFKFSPRKALSLLMWSVFSATFIYMAVTVSTAIAVGDNREVYEDLAWPPAVAIMDIIGPLGMILMVVSVSMGVLTGLNGFFAASSRVMLTMGRAAMLPDRFARLHPQYNTPAFAILVTMAVCMITPFFGRAALSWVVDMTSAGITVAYFYTCYCAFKVGRDGYVAGMKQRQRPSTRQMWFGLAGAGLAVIFLLLLLVPSSPGALSTESLLALAVWLVGGFVFYLVRRPAFSARSNKALEALVFS